MRLLLDSHVLLWWDSDLKRLSRVQDEAISDPVNTVFVSAVSAWELNIKRVAGRLVLRDSIPNIVQRFGFVELPITMRHGEVAAGLDWAHRDPFDRMLVAQASTERLTLVTADRTMRQYRGISFL